MATYQILEDIHYYLKDTSTGYAGWGTFDLGSTATGGPIAGVSNTTWRTIMGVTITPAVGEKVTSFTLNIGLIKQDGDYDNVKLGGYLYSDFNTAKGVSGPPSGYIAHFEESSAIYTPYSGRIVNMTFSGLNITTTTTLYVWFYVSPSYYCQIWTGKTGNFKNETNFPSVTFNTIEPVSYTATFNANGGTTPSPQTITKAYGATLGTLPTTSRTGYTFKGWYTAASGGTKISTTTTMPANNVTYYAQWSIIQYTISYDANGGTGAPATQTKNYGTDLILSSTQPTWATSTDATYTITLNANGGSCSTSSLTTDKKTSHTFKKWNTKSNGSGTSYSPAATYSANAAATLYAQWTTSTVTAPITLPEATKTGSLLANYTITFNANGGTCDVVSLTSAKNNSYVFQGWSENTSATTGEKGTYTPIASKTLYAIWKESQITDAITLPTPTRANYVFKGWATSPSAVSGSFGSYVPNETTTLYAIWGTDDNAGLIYIDNGSGWEAYEVYIDNGTTWEKYIPYIDNGTTWELYS